MARSIFFSGPTPSSPIKPQRQVNGECLPSLFRLAAVEYLMRKGLTGGGSRRYLWASLVVRINAQRGRQTRSWKSRVGSAVYGK